MIYMEYVLYLVLKTLFFLLFWSCGYPQNSGKNVSDKNG